MVMGLGSSGRPSVTRRPPRETNNLTLRFLNFRGMLPTTRRGPSGEARNLALWVLLQGVSVLGGAGTGSAPPKSEVAAADSAIALLLKIERPGHPGVVVEEMRRGRACDMGRLGLFPTM